jgi:hypothetical protein
MRRGQVSDPSPDGTAIRGKDQVLEELRMGDEEAQAQYYQAHKDDVDGWGEPERPPSSSKRRLATMISVRFSPDEARIVRQAAESANESLSQFVRKAALQRCQRHQYGPLSISGTAQEVSRSLFISWATSRTEGEHEASEGSPWKLGDPLISFTGPSIATLKPAKSHKK